MLMHRIMQDRVIAAIAIIFGLTIGGCAIFIWQVSQPDKPVAKQAVQTATNDSAPASAGNALSNNTPKTQQPGSTNNQSSDQVTLDPTKFKAYEKYKDGQTAFFAELTKGNGAEATAGKKLSVLYRGWLTDGRIFDQNADQNKPFSFTLGSGQVIAGWEQGLAGMKVGGERLIIVPPAAGYGAVANGPIPANAVLVFDVKLVAVE